MEFASEWRPANAESESAEAGGDNFSVEDLLDFSNDDGNSESFAVTGNSVDSSPVAGAVDSCNSSSLSCNTATEYHFSTATPGIAVSDSHFSGGLCIPNDDAAELEWLSNFVEEETFSKEDLQKLHLLSGLATAKGGGGGGEGRRVVEESNQHPLFRGELVSVPGKARSKRARAGPSNWANSQLRSLSTKTSSTSIEYKLLSDPDTEEKQSHYKKRKGGGDHQGPVVLEPNGLVRRCLHCDTDKTPQWRTGPKGPKTLCNACGVRYKSGRLVPEYRPASSPTFVQTKHSSSHRKVMELRRQKEAASFLIHHQPPDSHNLQRPPPFLHNRILVDVPNPDDYFLHPRLVPHFNLD